MFLFFFSSRRRHTRWPRDWSSDVCSSDLERGKGVGRLPGREPQRAAGGDRLDVVVLRLAPGRVVGGDVVAQLLVAGARAAKHAVKRGESFQPAGRELGDRPELNPRIGAGAESLFDGRGREVEELG